MIPEIIKISSDPAAGVELAYTADEDMVVHSVRFVFATDATVANRVVVLVADDGTNEFWRSESGYSHTAGISVAYCAFEGAQKSATLSVMFPLPTRGLRLRKGDRLLTTTSGKQAGDNFGAMTLQAERTMEGAQ